MVPNEPLTELPNQNPNWLSNIKIEKSLTKSNLLLSSHYSKWSNRKEHPDHYDIKEINSFTKTLSHNSTYSNQHIILD
jgi:hypothetical protein